VRSSFLAFNRKAATFAVSSGTRQVGELSSVYRDEVKEYDRISSEEAKPCSD
jgi:hypothetical protein